MPEHVNLRQLTSEELLSWQLVTGANLKRDDLSQFPESLVAQWRQRIVDIDNEILRRNKREHNKRRRNKKRGERYGYDGSGAGA